MPATRVWSVFLTASAMRRRRRCCNGTTAHHHPWDKMAAPDSSTVASAALPPNQLVITHSEAVHRHAAMCAIAICRKWPERQHRQRTNTPPATHGYGHAAVVQPAPSRRATSQPITTMASRHHPGATGSRKAKHAVATAASARQHRARAQPPSRCMPPCSTSHSISASCCTTCGGGPANPPPSAPS